MALKSGQQQQPAWKVPLHALPLQDPCRPWAGSPLRTRVPLPQRSAAVSDIGPASVLPPIAAGALNQPRHLLQSPCLFQPVYFCFAGPRQEEGACLAFELCPNKMLKQPWEDISQVCGQHHPGRGSPGNSQGTEPLVTKVFLPSSPCRGMTQAWLPSPSLSLL